MRTALALLTAHVLAAGIGGAQALELKSAHYTIAYPAGYEKDAEFTRTWLDRAEQLMRDKYGVTADGYAMSVVLFSEPAAGIDANQSGQNQCCASGTSGVRTGTINLLARSAPVWRSTDLKSSLDLPKAGDDYHAKVIVSEYIPIGHYRVQDARPSGGWRYYSAPDWVVQGLQEYDAIFHSTEANRTTTSRRLMQWAKEHPAAFSCCAAGLTISDAYNGGATFMAFLAAQFGEDVHVKLLRSGAPTFEAALSEVTKPFSARDLFDAFQEWRARLP